MMLMEGRAIWEFGAFMAALPWLSMGPRGDGQPVLVIPGLATDDSATLPLQGLLRELGYAAYGWSNGFNDGRWDVLDSHLLRHLERLRQRHDATVSLIGWSMGGLYARELAKQAPQNVRQVIMLGSPFAGDPRVNNIQLFPTLVEEQVAAEDLERSRTLHRPPPVPTTSIFSRTDGLVSWQCCVEKDSPQVENIEVDASHWGLVHHPAALHAIADRLAQPEGQWRPFKPQGPHGMLYPDPQRS